MIRTKVFCDNIIPKTRKNSVGKLNCRTGFSLAELIVAIALLSIFGVIVARMYFISDQVAHSTKQLDKAIVVTSNIVDQWKSWEIDAAADGIAKENFSDLSGLDMARFVQFRSDGEKWIGQLDSEMNIVENTESEYNIVVELKKSDNDNIWVLNVSILNTDDQKKDSVFYEVRSSRYFPPEVLK